MAVAVGIHVAAAIALAVEIPRRQRPQIRFEGMPIQLLSLSPPPSIRGRGAPRAAAEAGPPARKQERPAEKRPGESKSKPEKPRSATPVPRKDAPNEPHPLTQAGTATDTTRTLRGEVPVGEGGEGSVEMSVEGPISEYAYYLMSVRDKIASNWNPPAGILTSGREVATMVNFRVDRSGKVTASYVEEPSGTNVFDQAGLRAVAQADPLPPLPQDYSGDWLGIHLRFVYKE